MRDTLHIPRSNALVATIIAIIVIVCCALLLASSVSPSGYRAIAHDSNGDEHAIDLSQERSYVFETDLGYNVVEVKGGQLRVSDADCPNHDCLRQHAISKPGEQLICLPHRFWVEIVGEGQSGGAMDTGAVRSDPDVDIVGR